MNSIEAEAKYKEAREKLNETFEQLKQMSFELKGNKELLALAAKKGADKAVKEMAEKQTAKVALTLQVYLQAIEVASGYIEWAEIRAAEIDDQLKAMAIEYEEPQRQMSELAKESRFVEAHRQNRDLSAQEAQEQQVKLGAQMRELQAKLAAIEIPYNKLRLERQAIDIRLDQIYGYKLSARGLKQAKIEEYARKLYEEACRL
jgi:chromosome segregation ATPase